MNDRHALEVQIMEFGQVPKQLFTKPHVKRIIHQVKKPLTSHSVSKYQLECIDVLTLHKEAVNCALRHKDWVISVGKDGTLKVYDLIQKKQIRSALLSFTPLSCCALIDDGLVAVGAWDNEM